LKLKCDLISDALLEEREYKVLIGTPIIKMQMGSVTRYHCDKCGMEFDSLAELNTHQITKHTTV